MPLPVINTSQIIQASMSLNFEIPKQRGHLLLLILNWPSGNRKVRTEIHNIWEGGLMCTETLPFVVLIRDLPHCGFNWNLPLIEKQ
jgi:hypothetical protein